MAGLYLDRGIFLCRDGVLCGGFSGGFYIQDADGEDEVSDHGFPDFRDFSISPGARVYYTAYYLVTGQTGLAGQSGLEALKIAFAIVLGIVLVVSIPREVFQGQYWKNGRRRRQKLK